MGYLVREAFTHKPGPGIKSEREDLVGARRAVGLAPATGQKGDPQTVTIYTAATGPGVLHRPSEGEKMMIAPSFPPSRSQARSHSPR